MSRDEIERLRMKVKFQSERIRYLEGRLGMDLPTIESGREREYLSARIRQLEEVIARRGN
jgi:hypothetical protein